MKTYIVLLRGINVGGKNMIPMAKLRSCLEDMGFHAVTTYLQSGNVILRSDLDEKGIKNSIEAMLPKEFALTSSSVSVLVLTSDQLKAIITSRPKGFRDKPNLYHSDTIFLIGITPVEALAVFRPKEGVDEIWAGENVIYSQRLSALRTKSRLNRIIGTPAYKNMTIRNWRTTVALLSLAQTIESDKN